MAITQEFDGQLITEAGVYGSRRSGEAVTPPAPTFGNVLLINTNNPYMVGAGVSGENFQGKRALYRYNTKNAFQNRIRGGELFDLANPIFDPQSLGTQNGADSLSIISACSSRSARLAISFSGGVGGGAKATANLKAVTATIPTGLGGSGYAVNDTVTLLGGTFTTAVVLTVTTVNAGAITGVNITTAGVYTVAPTGNATQGTTSGVGTGAQFSLLFGLNAVVISNGGTGYTAPPTVRFFGNGSGAVGTATLTLGVVTTVTIGTAGSGYTQVADLFFVATNANGGEFIFKTLVEGTSANGFETAGEVTRGFGMTMSVGTVDTSKFFLTFCKGTFTGLDADGLPYNGVLEVDSDPQIIAISDEFNTYDELLTWADRSNDFKAWFIRESSVKYGTGAVTSGDLTNNLGNILAVQGTQTFGTSFVTSVLDSIEDADFDFILCLEYGATSNGSQSVNNTKIFNFVKGIKSKNLPQIFVAGGKDETQFTPTYGSIDTANYYNNECVTVVHSDIEITGVNGLRRKNVLYHASLIMGLEAGLEPQEPLTNKVVSIRGVVHDMSKNQRTVALQSGVLFLKQNRQNFWIVAQGINSTGEPKNKQLLWEDGTSFEKSMRRIDSAILKEIRTQAEALGFGGGGNRNTASVANVKSFLETYLQTRISTPVQDSLLITYRNVQVEQVEDCNKATFEIVKNSPINKLYFQAVSVLNVTI